MSVKKAASELNTALMKQGIDVEFSGATPEQRAFFNYAGKITGELQDFFDVYPNETIEFPYTNISLADYSIDVLQKHSLERAENPTKYPLSMVCIAGCNHGPEVYFVNTDETNRDGICPVRFFLTDYKIDPQAVARESVIVAHSITNLLNILTTLVYIVTENAWDYNIWDNIYEGCTPKTLKDIVRERIKTALLQFEPREVVEWWNKRIG